MLILFPRLRQRCNDDVLVAGKQECAKDYWAEKVGFQLHNIDRKARGLDIYVS